jgi:hypothetical protein
MSPTKRHENSIIRMLFRMMFEGINDFSANVRNVDAANALGIVKMGAANEYANVYKPTVRASIK